MQQFVTLRPRAYSYLIDGGDENKKGEIKNNKS